MKPNPRKSGICRIIYENKFISQAISCRRKRARPFYYACGIYITRSSTKLHHDPATSAAANSKKIPVNDFIPHGAEPSITAKYRVGGIRLTTLQPLNFILRRVYSPIKV